MKDGMNEDLHEGEGRKPQDGAPLPERLEPSLAAVLARRRDRLDASTPPADDALLQAVRARLQREGLSGEHAWEAPRPTPPQRRSLFGLGGHRPLGRWPLAGLAATVMLGVAVVAQLDSALREQAQADVLRGGHGAVLELRVAQPEAALAQWLVRLEREAPGALDAQVTRHPDGRITLSVSARPEVLDALAAQRLEPPVRGGRAVIVLRPSAGAP
jgi:hypothetical protein